MLAMRLYGDELRFGVVTVYSFEHHNSQEPPSKEKQKEAISSEWF